MPTETERTSSATTAKAEAPPAVRVCSFCVMDASDPDITFDERGRCRHCREAERLLAREPYALAPDEKARRLDALCDRIRSEGRGRDVDCVIGVSGGVDSSYVAHVVKKLGLRPLAVHLDNGWNSRLAVANIERILNKLGIELFTYVIDWEEFKDLQLSFIKASVPDLEIPTDHAIVATLFHVAAREGIRHILLGTNLSTESILPPAWSHGHDDWKYIRSIHRRFGTAKLATFPHLSLARRLYYKRVKKISVVSILDYVPYVKSDALALLEREYGWEPYGGKHHESIYTRWYQAHVLPSKFGFDKRRAHLSSLIASKQCTREQALDRLREPLYEPRALVEDTEYVANKFGITTDELERLLALPPKTFADYPSYERSALYRFGKAVLRRLPG